MRKKDELESSGGETGLKCVAGEGGRVAEEECEHLFIAGIHSLHTSTKGGRSQCLIPDVAVTAPVPPNRPNRGAGLRTGQVLECSMANAMQRKVDSVWTDA